MKHLIDAPHLIPIPPSVIENGFKGLDELPAPVLAFIFGFFIAGFVYVLYSLRD